MPRWVVARADEEEEEASSEEDSGAEEEQEQGQLAAYSGAASDADSGSDAEEDEGVAEQAAPSTAPASGGGGASASRQGSAGARKGKLKIALAGGGGGAAGSGKGLTCHVCGKRGHNAGFVGSVYMDCPNRPCYLCKQSGHTTMTCPYRVAPEHGCAAAASVARGSVLDRLRKREHDGRLREVRADVARWQVDVALLRLHSRRCCCLEFHPTRDNIVVSGDKKGQVAVWDWMKGYEHTVYNTNRALTNNLRFMPGGDGMKLASAAADGTLKVVDIETGLDEELLNLNPEGWIPGVSNERTWGMLYGLDCCRASGTLFAGDSHGFLHVVDPRMRRPAAKQQVHRKGNKVTSLHVHPLDANILLSASNDWTARLSDIRRLSGQQASTSASATPSRPGKEPAWAGAEVAAMEHPKVVNSAYFSPNTGTKILTTCIDNRLRVWDYIYGACGPPDREIVHSHDFNRYLTPFRAEWDPKDPQERTLVVGRYISEDFGGAALHPVDVLDAATGRALAQLVDPNLATICPVNKPHPRADLIVSGSSRSLFGWRPAPPPDEEDGGACSSARPSSSRSDTTSAALDLGALLQGSANFVFYDAEAGADGNKKKARRSGELPAELEDPDDTPPKKGKGKGKKK